MQKEGRGRRAEGVQRLWLGGTPAPSQPGSAQAAESWRGQASRWVAATAPSTPGPAAAHRAESPSLLTAAPGTAGAAAARGDMNLAAGGTAPLTGGGGAADPSPPSRWALPLRDGASHPPRASASPLPAVTHRLVHPAGRDARPGERGAEV